MTDFSGKTALHYCVENQSPDIADLILTADKRILNRQDNDGYTALHLSVISHNRRVLECLFGHGADPSCIDNEGHNCIHWATGSSIGRSYAQCTKLGS